PARPSRPTGAGQSLQALRASLAVLSGRPRLSVCTVDSVAPWRPLRSTGPLGPLLTRRSIGAILTRGTGLALRALGPGRQLGLTGENDFVDGLLDIASESIDCCHGLISSLLDLIDDALGQTPGGNRFELEQGREQDRLIRLGDFHVLRHPRGGGGDRSPVLSRLQPHPVVALRVDEGSVRHG